jgi:hypothetical protein
VTDRKLEFFFRDGVVGYWLSSEYPRVPGLYRYMPCRSGAHFFMHEQRRSTGAADCTFVSDEVIVRFRVIGCPEHGVLELADFRID